MRLIKKIPLATLEIDTTNGVIWLNNIFGCILRMNNILFKDNNNLKDRFNFIDIINNQAYIQNTNSVEELDDDILTFIEEVFAFILYQSSTKKINKEKLFKSIFVNMKQFCESYLGE